MILEAIKLLNLIRILLKNEKIGTELNPISKFILVNRTSSKTTVLTKSVMKVKIERESKKMMIRSMRNSLVAFKAVEDVQANYTLFLNRIQECEQHINEHYKIDELCKDAVMRLEKLRDKKGARMSF